MTWKDRFNEELIPCGCNCGTLIKKYDNKGRERKFVNRHYWRGKKFSEGYKKKLSDAKKGKKMHETSNDKHWNWKGDEVKYGGLHGWVRRHLPKPENCHLCKEKEPKEVACITGIYNRELRNWAWFCISCHRKWDNIGIRVSMTLKQK